MLFYKITLIDVPDKGPPEEIVSTVHSIPVSDDREKNAKTLEEGINNAIAVSVLKARIKNGDPSLNRVAREELKQLEKLLIKGENIVISRLGEPLNGKRTIIFEVG